MSGTSPPRRQAHFQCAPKGTGLQCCAPSEARRTSARAKERSAYGSARNWSTVIKPRNAASRWRIGVDRAAVDEVEHPISHGSRRL